MNMSEFNQYKIVMSANYFVFLFPFVAGGKTDYGHHLIESEEQNFLPKYKTRN